MTPKQERHIVASVGTLLFMGFVLLLLFLLEITATKPQEEDYIEVVFEEDVEEIQEPEIPKVKPDPAPSQEKDPGAASPAPVTPTPPNNQPTQKTAEQIVSHEDNQTVINQRIADSIAEANRKAVEKAESIIPNFPPVVEDEGKGAASNHTLQDGKGTAPKGEGSDGVNKWSLAGRGLVGNLPKPKNSFNQEGTVVVQISVDERGNVIDAQEWKGGTISDKATIQLAIEAAKKAKFDAATVKKQVGTITYKFKFN